MPSSTWFGPQHINENMLCAIGIKTTGKDHDVHELIDVAALPLDAGWDMRNDRPIFHVGIKPENLTNLSFGTIEHSKADVANKILWGKDASACADMFVTWFESLKLREGKKVVPLAWNWPDVSVWLRNWLGNKTFDYIFDWRFRDVLSTINHINDTLDLSGNTIVFPKITIGSIALRSNIERIRPETALTRAKVLVDIYKMECQYRTKPMF